MNVWYYSRVAYMFDHTSSVLNKIKNDLKKLVFITDIILQIIFIFFYVYSIIRNLSNFILLSIYSALLFISALYFIFHITTLKISSKYFHKVVKKNIKRGIRYSKYLVRIFTIALSIYDIMSNGASDLAIIITAVTAISLIIQLILEVIQYLLIKYINLLTMSFKMDMEKNTFGKVIRTYNTFKDIKQDKKGAILTAIKKPVEIVADKISGEKTNSVPVLTEKEKMLREQINQIKEESNIIKEVELSKRINEKHALKKNELKEHIGVIKKKIKEKIKIG